MFYPFQLNSAAQKLRQVSLSSCDFRPRPVLERQWDILDLMLQAALRWKKSFGNLKNVIFGFDEGGKPVQLEKNSLKRKEQMDVCGVETRNEPGAHWLKLFVCFILRPSSSRLCCKKNVLV